MLTQLQKRTDGYDLLIPTTMLESTNLHLAHDVEIVQQGNTLVIRSRKAHPTLDELVAQITDENRHDEISTGAPVGAEVW
jgi:antitoxin MazE